MFLQSKPLPSQLRGTCCSSSWHCWLNQHFALIMEYFVEPVLLAGHLRRRRNHSLQHIKDMPRFSNRDLHSNLERVDF